MNSYLSTEEAARELGRSALTLRRWRSKGVGPAYIKVNRNFVVYRRQDIDVWLAEHVVRPNGRKK